MHSVFMYLEVKDDLKSVSDFRFFIATATSVIENGNV